MMHGLSPYQEYKASRHLWLGSIPAHWHLQKLKHLTRFVNGLPFKPGSWSSHGVPIIRIQNLNGSRHFNYTDRQDLPRELLIHPGDLLFAWSGNRGTSFGPTIWNRDFFGYLNQHIFKLVGYSLDTRYFAYVLRAVTAHIEGEKTHGIIGLVHITKPELGSAEVPIASPAEQAAIVRYLDWANARLERAIRAKRKIIALLNEQKQAIIYRAVTRGLDPNVTLRPSGQDWLGEVPAHWKVVRIKSLLGAVDRRSSTGTEELLSLRMYHGIVLFHEHFQRPPQARTLVNFKLVEPGQFVVNRMQAGNGLIYCSSYSGLVSPDYSVFDVIANINKDFLGELLRCGLMRWRFRVESTGLGTGTSGFLRLYDDRFGAVHLALPPLEEQDTIMTQLDAKLADIEQTMDRVQRELALFLEYRTCLVADVVTGKLDVREAAARLPAEEPIEIAEDELAGDDAELEDGETESAA
jgi:type I restriction enzyme S subunit